MAQGLIGDEKYLRLDDLVEVTEINPSRDHVRQAVYNHVRKNSKQIGNNPEGLLAKVGEAGLIIEVDTEMHNQVAGCLVSNAEDVRSATSYLKRLTGLQDFSEEVHSATKNRMVSDLSNADSSQYAALKELGADAKKLNEEEKEKIARGIMGKLKENPNSNLYRAEQIVNLTGVHLQADTYDLGEMVRKYFDGGIGHVEPSRIAKLLNMSLLDGGRVQTQIFDRTIQLIHENHLDEAKKLFKDNGIHPTKSGAEKVLKEYAPQHQEIMKGRLNLVYGRNSGLS